MSNPLGTARETPKPAARSALRALGLAAGTVLFLLAAVSAPGADEAALSAAVAEIPTDTPGLALRRAALEVAVEEVKLRRDRGDIAGSDRLAGEILAAVRTPVTPAVPPEGGFPFLPPLRSVVPNPYLDALQRWFARETAKPDSGLPVVTPANNPMNSINGPLGTRAVGNDMLRYFWLGAHPQSPLKDNPEALKRLLRRANLYLTAYRLHAKKYEEPINDFFAANPAFAAVRQTVEVYPDLLLPTQRSDWDAALRSAGAIWLDVYTNGYKLYPVAEGRFCNHHIGIANTMLSIGKYLGDGRLQTLATGTIKRQGQNLLPDGAFHYITDYNEVANYHSTVIDLLVDYAFITGDTSVYELIAGSRNYTALSIADGAVSEFSTAPDWKWMWNSLPGNGGEPVIALTRDPYERFITDLSNKQRGVPPDIQGATFYTPGVAARPVPTDFLVYDRNIQGARARFGRFATTLNGRNFDPTPSPDGVGDAPGKLTFAGGLVVDKDQTRPGPIDAILLAVYPKVQVKTDKGAEWLDWAYLTRDEHTTVATTRSAASLATTHKLQSTAHAQATAPWPWTASQEWITLPDRVIGLVEVAPLGEQKAHAVDGRVRFGYGRSGDLRPKELTATAENRYSYGELTATIHASNFAGQTTGPAGMLRDSPPNASEIILRDSPPSPEARRFTPDDARFFAVEVRPDWVKDEATVQRLAGPGWRALVAAVGGKVFAVWHNLSGEALEVDLAPAMVDGQTTSLHFPRGDEPGREPVTAETARVSVPPGDHILVVTSGDPADHRAGWRNFPAYLEQAGADDPR
jgi:hypothetical protein